MSEVHFVTFVPSLIKQWRSEREEVLQKWEELRNDSKDDVEMVFALEVHPGGREKSIDDELNKLANRYLHRCLVNINTKKRVLTIKDSIINREDCREINAMLEDLQSPGLEQIRQVDTNMLRIVENVAIFKKTLPKLSLLKLSSYMKGLPVMHFNVINGEIRQFILANERLDSDDSSSLSNILQGLSGQYLQYIEVVNCVFDYTFQPNFYSKCQLTTLNMSGSCFADTPHTLSLFGALRRLTTLDLSSCGLDTDCIDSLKGMFTESCNIEHLNLSNNNFGNKDNELLRAISTLKNLKSLHLYHCMLSRNCSSGLNSIAQGNSTTLKKLTLNFNHFMGNPEILSAVADCIALEELYLYKAEMRSRNCISLKEIVQSNERLRILDLSCNNLGGGTDMLQSLSVCQNLEQLGLSNCTLLDTCIYRIGTMLKTNKKLKELNLSGNKFTDHRSLFNALCFGTKLEKLYLKDINLTKPPLPSLFDKNNDEDMDGTLVMTASAEQTALEKAFQEFVEATSRMKVIEFAYNQLWPIFIDKMTSWTQLKKLYLYHCELNYDSVNALIRLLKVNESLRALDLEGNGFEKTKNLFATLADSSVNSIDLRQISLEDKRFEQIVSLIKTARAKHQKIKKLLPTASKIPAVLEGVKLSGVDHIWISENDNLTLDGLNKVLMGVDDKDRTCSAPKRMEERQTDSRRCSLVTNKAEFLERINNSKSMPIIH